LFGVRPGAAWMDAQRTMASIGTTNNWLSQILT